MAKNKNQAKKEEPADEIEKAESSGPYLLSLYGKIEEEDCAEIVRTLYAQKLVYDNDIKKSEAVKLIISTHGGDAVEMFSVYDMIKHVQKTYPVHTVGVGKVMSAGTLLLAAGTKGKRKIGANCRLMVHNVKGGAPIPECFSILKGEIKEIEWFQERYISCLVKETNLSKEDLREVLDSRQNVYLDAKEAIECGFADKII
tara:strand:+ start:73 stop:672 length:600 start_codon:yes stop_codon:yes gene_type:complete